MKVYDVIKTAEDTYINETSHLSYPGMCWCLKVAATKGLDFKDKNRKGHPSYKDLVTNIPEFNPEFLKATKDVQHAGLDFWWDHHLKSCERKLWYILRSRLAIVMWTSVKVWNLLVLP